MPESLRLFILCEGMNWSNLPVAGGLYDQHPKLLDDWLAIWAGKARAEDRKNAVEERKKPPVNVRGPK